MDTVYYNSEKEFIWHIRYDNMDLEAALSKMDNLFDRLKKCISTAGKKNNGEEMIFILNNVEEVNNYWEYKKDEFYWDNRFSRRVKVESIKEKPPASYENITSGLYLVGNTTFNPFTDEKFYWIKVGQAKDLNKRMRSYATHNPCLWKADFKEINIKYLDLYESEAHCQLKEICLSRAENSREWFAVPKETYLAICALGFQWFDFHCSDYISTLYK